MLRELCRRSPRAYSSSGRALTTPQQKAGRNDAANEYHGRTAASEGAADVPQIAAALKVAGVAASEGKSGLHRN
ncbi:MAG: hypothetical protein WKG07_01970 [Hymenobacter sp.]